MNYRQKSAQLFHCNYQKLCRCHLLRQTEALSMILPAVLKEKEVVAAYGGTSDTG